MSTKAKYTVIKVDGRFCVISSHTLSVQSSWSTLSAARKACADLSRMSR